MSDEAKQFRRAEDRANGKAACAVISALAFITLGVGVGFAGGRWEGRDEVHTKILCSSTGFTNAMVAPVSNSKLTDAKAQASEACN